jgi:hypothetical protein
MDQAGAMPPGNLERLGRVYGPTTWSVYETAVRAAGLPGMVTQPVSRALLRLARLRRQREDIVAHHGQDIYDQVEANLHWELFQFLGKLEPLVHVLRAQ